MRISDWSSDVCASDLAELLHLHALGLAALVGGAPLGIVAGAREQMVEGGARLVEHRAVLGEDREAARAAVVVALVGDDEALTVEPLHGIGLAPQVEGGPIAGEDRTSGV